VSAALANKHYRIVKNPNPKVVVVSGEVEHVVKYNMSSSFWECSCKKLMREGLPCQHLLLVVILFKGEIAFYVNSRWYLEEPFKLKDKSEEVEDSDSYL
jgi:hypothetical protein